MNNTIYDNRQRSFNCYNDNYCNLVIGLDSDYTSNGRVQVQNLGQSQGCMSVAPQQQLDILPLRKIPELQRLIPRHFRIRQNPCIQR